MGLTMLPVCGKLGPSMDPIERFRADVAASGRVLSRIDEIAAATGITAKTLRNWHYKATRGQRYDNVRRLEEFYAREGQAA